MIWTERSVPSLRLWGREFNVRRSWESKNGRSVTLKSGPKISPSNLKLS